MRATLIAALVTALFGIPNVPTVLAAQQQTTTRSDSTSADSSATDSLSSTQQLLWDTEPPTVYISPAGGTFSSATRSVIIDWEDDTQIDDGTITIFFNGSNIAGSFAYTSRGIDRGTSTGTVTLKPGSNTLTASIYDLAGHKGTKTATYTFQAAPPTVTVTPTGLADGDTVSRSGGESDSVSFTVQSSGGPSGGSTYNLTASCSGDAIVSTCVPSPSSLSISPGSSKSAWVKFSTGSAAAERGKAQLLARYSLDNTVKDSGWVSVRTTLPCTETLSYIDPCTFFQARHTGETYTQNFRVTSNNQIETTPYTLTLVTEGNGIASASIPSNSINVPPSSSVIVTVTYTTIDSTTLVSVTGSPSGTASAKLTLSADDGSGPVAGNVDVAVTLPPPAPPMHRVALSPHYTTLASADRSRLYPIPFRVTNAGTDTATYRYTLHCSGSAIAANCDGGAKPDTVSLGVIQPESTSVFQAALTTTSAAGAASGEMSVTVWRVADSQTRDSATAAVTLDSSSPTDQGIADLNPGSTIERSLCLGISVAPGRAWECGDLRVAEATSGVATVGKWRSPVLLYNSAHARPKVTVRARVALPNDGRIPDSVVVRLLQSPSGAQLARGKWAGSNWTAASTRQVALSFDASSDSTGIFPYLLEVTRQYGASAERDTATGEFAVVNRGTSSFGAGWWLAGLERLHDESDGSKLWVAGDGSTRRYAADVGDPDIFRAESLYRPDSIVRAGSGASVTYTRYLPHGVKVMFDALGRHVATTDRLGRTTSFRYDGATSFLLDSIVVPSGAATTVAFEFRYDTVAVGGTSFVRLQAIEAPAIDTLRRVDSLVINSAGDLTKIVHADGQAVSFAYTTSADGVGAHRMKSSTDERDKSTLFTYDPIGFLETSALELDTATSTSIMHTFHAAMARGRSGTAAVPLDLAYTSYDGPREDVGDSTLFWTDRFGAPERIRNALGDETTLDRGNTTFPSLVTRLRLPSGQVTSATYDTHGNVTSVTDSATYMDPDGSGPQSSTYAKTRYSWDTKWDFVTETINPAGDSFTASYDATTGNMLWSEDGRGAMSRTSFYYYPSSHVAHGLLRSVVYPGQAASEGDSLSYDMALLNVDSTVDAAERVTSYTRDAAGQVTGVTYPSAITEEHHLDIMGRVTLSITTDTISKADTAWVRSHYDEAGNLDSLFRASLPDPAGLDTLVQVFTYDAANRKIAETLLGGPSGSETVEWNYDLAGNLLSGGRRPTRNRYDALNRLVRKAGSDVSTYVYDAVGNVLAADNSSARVSRAYNANGTLRSDTLRIATRSGADFTQHVYDVHYEYDIDGRRTSLTQGSGSGAEARTYEYETATGRLNSVIDPDEHQYTVAYDSTGRVSRIIRLAGETDSIVETRRYDKLSRLLRRIQWRPSTGDTLHSDSLIYDRHDKVVGNLPGGDELGYDALGHLSSSAIGASGPESYTYDALGHRSWGVQGGDNYRQSYYAYVSGTERLAFARHPTLPDPDTTYYFHDAIDGALGEERSVHYFRVSGGCELCSTKYYEQRSTVNFYDDERRLVKSMFHLDSLETPTTPYPDPHYQRYSRTESYRYDALDRRVWTEAFYGTNCSNHDKSSGCHNAVTRTVWDGNAMLAEMRSLPDTTPPVSESEWDTGLHYGRVTYTYLGGVLGMDSPVSLEKQGTLVVPLTRWNGVIESGACPGSTNDDCSLLYVSFPGATGSAYGEAVPSGDGPPSWFGSMLTGMRDASGYLYRRNRYYDPKTGRFTQQDPIGLAGGMNTYGYAEGDPVNYSDPFGLKECPPQCLEVFADIGRRTSPLKKFVEWVGEFVGLKNLADAGTSAEKGHFLAAAGSLILAGSNVLPEGRAGAKVLANLNRTLKGAQGAEVAVTRVGRFIKATWEVAGEGGGESRTVWSKFIGEDGKTVKMFHDSYDRAGVFQHRKFKFPDTHIAY
jgi:RHS repeat-associated protein